MFCHRNKQARKKDNATDNLGLYWRVDSLRVNYPTYLYGLIGVADMKLQSPPKPVAHIVRMIEIQRGVTLAPMNKGSQNAN
jgi:hypothetical protein